MAQILPRLEFLAQSLLRRQRLCPHCAGGTHTILARKFGVIRVKRCRDCALCFTDPIYRTHLSDNFYDEKYETEGSTTATPDAEQLEQFKREGFGSSDKDFSARLERIWDVAPGPELLELGSSWGYFLYQAKTQGFQPTGVEIADRRRAFGQRELGVPIASSFDELAGRLFDVVYTAHVLEHFTDLSSIFQTLYDFLKPGGVLLIEVPHFAFDSRGKAALSAVGAIHPLGFTSEFFELNLPRHGFKLLGFYDSWEEFPEKPQGSSEGDNVIVMATRESA